jgi:hypothetical protein
MAYPMNDPEFPALPYVSPQTRESWTAEQKQARHDQEVAAANDIFVARQKAGQIPTEAAMGLPVPYMNRAGYHRDRNGEWLANNSRWDTAEEGRQIAREAWQQLSPHQRRLLTGLGRGE